MPSALKAHFSLSPTLARPSEFFPTQSYIMNSIVRFFQTMTTTEFFAVLCKIPMTETVKNGCPWSFGIWECMQVSFHRCSYFYITLPSASRFLNWVVLGPSPIFWTFRVLDQHMDPRRKLFFFFFIFLGLAALRVTHNVGYNHLLPLKGP